MRTKAYKVIIKELRLTRDEIVKCEDKTIRAHIYFRHTNYIDGYIYGVASSGRMDITLNMLNLYIHYKQSIYAKYVQ